MGSLNQDVRDYVQETVGEEGMAVVDLLVEYGEATDSTLAEDLDRKPSHIRKVLYDLYANSVAEYEKKKDEDSGWLTFHWSLTPVEAQEAMQAEREELIGELEEALQFEQEHDFYVCPQGGERYDFTEAMELEFHCPDHEASLDHIDDNENIQILNRRIEQLRDRAES
jgi:transcription initiation factor TFIIE subunit alpha